MLIIFAVAFVVRLTAAFWSLPPVDQAYESVKVAISVALGHGLADPYLLPTGPTAHLAPGFPLVLGGVYRLFGSGAGGEMAKRILGCFVSALSYALLPPVAGKLGISRRVAVGAGIFGALLPFDRYDEMSGNWESPWAALALMALVYFYRQGRSFAFGVAGGLGVLFAPVLAPVFVVLRRDWRAWLIAAVLLLPWAWRNHQRLGAWVWMRDNFGLELSLSNNDGASASLRENIRSGAHQDSHPSLSVLEADKVAYWGEVEYNRRRFKTALAWIAANPMQFTALTAERMCLFWFSPLWFGAFTLLAWTALWVGGSRQRVVASIWLVFPMIYYVIQFDPRYRQPMGWTVLLMAAQTLDWWFCSWPGVLARARSTLSSSS